MQRFDFLLTSYYCSVGTICLKWTVGEIRKAHGTQGIQTDGRTAAMLNARGVTIHVYKGRNRIDTTHMRHRPMASCRDVYLPDGWTGIYLDSITGLYVQSGSDWFDLLPTALARTVGNAIVSVRLSIRLSVSTLTFKPSDFHLDHLRMCG